MSSKKTSAGEIAPPTEAAKERIWSEHDTFFLTTMNKGHSQVHLYHNCLSISTQDIIEKSPSVYPVGFKEVCKNCVYRWREGNDE